MAGASDQRDPSECSDESDCISSSSNLKSQGRPERTFSNEAFVRVRILHCDRKGVLVVVVRVKSKRRKNTKKRTYSERPEYLVSEGGINSFYIYTATYVLLLLFLFLLLFYYYYFL